MKLLKILALCCAVLLGFFVQDMLKSSSTSDSAMNVKDYCFLSTTACKQQHVTMTLEHDTAKPLVESQLTVDWPNASKETLLLEVEGLEMDMGISKFLLNKQPNGTYSAAIMLPVCTQDSMTWLGRLTDGTTTVHPAIRMER